MMLGIVSQMAALAARPQILIIAILGLMIEMSRCEHYDRFREGVRLPMASLASQASLALDEFASALGALEPDAKAYGPPFFRIAGLVLGLNRHRASPV
jgi:hypothetical protein